MGPRSACAPRDASPRAAGRKYNRDSCGADDRHTGGAGGAGRDTGSANNHPDGDGRGRAQGLDRGVPEPDVEPSLALHPHASAALAVRPSPPPRSSARPRPPARLTGILRRAG